jgi:hypothetical protein
LGLGISFLASVPKRKNAKRAVFRGREKAKARKRGMKRMGQRVEVRWEA